MNIPLLKIKNNQNNLTDQSQKLEQITETSKR